MIYSNIRYLYFVIPTINGEIFGSPFVLLDDKLIPHIADEVTVYKIDLVFFSCEEVSFK